MKLKNGLRLILMKRGTAPVAAAYIKFRVGSYDEKKENFGIAHMLEHMLFKGTRLVGTRNFAKEKKYLQLGVRYASKLDNWRRKKKQFEEKGKTKQAKIAQREIDKWQRRLQILNHQSRTFVIPEQDAYIYALNGARGYNAYTSSDFTNYQVNIPVNRLEVWARLEADRMQNAVLRDFYTEREVVREERRMRVENNIRSAFWEKFRKGIYGNHPYGHPVIGPMKSIQFLNYEQAMKFYKKYYAPNNTVIAIVGNIHIEKTKKIVQKYFTHLPSKYIPISKKPKKIQTSPPLILECNGGKSSTIYMAWLKPPIPHPINLHLEVLSEILAGSTETRLHKRLIVQEKVAVSVFAKNGVIGERAENLFFIGAEASPNTPLEKIKTLILDELVKIQKEGPSEDELFLARKRERLELINSFQSNASLADLLSYFETLTSDYRILFQYNADLDRVTSKSIQKVSSRFLQIKNVLLAQLMPTTQVDDFANSQKANQIKTNQITCSSNR